jgi:Cu+-exporting ATPase
MNCLARLPDKNDNVRLTQDKADFRVSVRARRLNGADHETHEGDLFFAFIYNALGVPIGGGVSYPQFGG